MKSTVSFCKEHPDIFFTRVDKGNITVAMDRQVYNNKMLALLNDKDTYSLVDKDPSPGIERKLNEILKKWLSKEYITKKKFFSLKTSDVPLLKAYGLPKIHKKDFPFRLIVSSTNSALYKLASFLNDIIMNSLPHTSGHVANSFDLYDRLSGVKLRNSDIIFSLNVTSLFTNVPLDLTFQSISNIGGTLLPLILKCLYKNSW